MVKILHPDRLGRIIIDGVRDADDWNKYAIDTFKSTSHGLLCSPTFLRKLLAASLLDMSNTFRAFASTCLLAGANCSLNAFNFSSTDSLLSTIDQTMDALYENPAPIYDLDQPAVATASDLRSALMGTITNIGSWPILANSLALALIGNFTPLVNIARPWLSKSNIVLPDNSPYAQNVIFVCRLIQSHLARVRADANTFLATVRRLGTIRRFTLAPNNGRNHASGSSERV